MPAVFFGMKRLRCQKEESYSHNCLRNMFFETRHVGKLPETGYGETI